MDGRSAIRSSAAESLYEPTDRGAADGPEQNDWNERLGNDCVGETEQRSNKKTAGPSRPGKVDRSEYKSDGETIDESAEQSRALVWKLHGNHRGGRQRAVNKTAKNPQREARHLGGSLPPAARGGLEFHDRGGNILRM
jgi:hypothetical protein